MAGLLITYFPGKHHFDQDDHHIGKGRGHLVAEMAKWGNQAINQSNQSDQQRN